jgi:hypothetical protein
VERVKRYAAHADADADASAAANAAHAAAVYAADPAAEHTLACVLGLELLVSSEEK